MNSFRSFTPWIGSMLMLLLIAFWITPMIEHSGLLACPSGCHHSESEKETSTPLSHCSTHCICHFTAFLTDFSLDLSSGFETRLSSFLNLNQITPDGPVFGIEYPPQLIA